MLDEEFHTVQREGFQDVILEGLEILKEEFLEK